MLVALVISNSWCQPLSPVGSLLSDLGVTSCCPQTGAPHATPNSMCIPFEFARANV